MRIFVLTHEYDNGFTSYAFSSEEKREEAAAILRTEYAKDFEAEKDFLIFDESDLDAMPWEVGSSDTIGLEQRV